MIPKTIHFCWLSGDAFPPLIERCVASWRERLPDYEIRTWTIDDPEIRDNRWVHEAFERRKYAFAADYVRLWAVYTHGGIYLDSDVEVVRSLDDLLSVRSFMGYESAGDVEPAVFGAEQGTEWVGRCLAYYDGRSFVRPDGSLDATPLPMVLEKVLGTDLPCEEPRKPVWCEPLEGCMLYPSDYFSPKSHYRRHIAVTDNTRTIHHFTATWLNKEAFGYRFKRWVHIVLTAVLGRRRQNRLIKFLRRLR